MVLERFVPLLQLEEEEFGPDEGDPYGTTERKTMREKRKQKQREHMEVTVLVGSSVTFLREARRRGVQKTKVFHIQLIEREHRQGRHSSTDKH